MLQIEIIGIDANGGLELRDNDNHNRGRSSPRKGQEVLWKVRPNSGVRSILAITMKSNVAGNENVFSSNPPTPINPQKTIWKGEVNMSADTYAVYVYDIVWIKDSDGSTQIFDPIISIRPIRAIADNTFLYNLAITTAIVTTLTAITLGYLLYSSKQAKSGLKKIDKVTAPVR